MKQQTIKTSIRRLLKRYPHKYRYELLSEELGISTRWIRILEKGEKPPSSHLRKLIKLLEEQDR